VAKVYVEARPKGRPEGSSIEDYVVEEHGDRVLKIFKKQEEAIGWAKSQGHSPHVARVRHLNDKKIPDHWRAIWGGSVIRTSAQPDRVVWLPPNVSGLPRA
jgi:hypothetical protein